MPDIGVEIFGPNKTAYSVEAPADMKAGDFLADVAENFALQGAGWRLYDKDLQRDLDPEVTLGDNGVAAGHHIYLRQPRPPAPPPPPPHPAARWLWVAPAIGAFLLGAAVSYLLRANTPDPAVPELRRQLEERATIVSGLKQQLEQSSKSVDEKTRTLETDLAAKTAESQDFKAQLANATRDLQGARRRIGELLAQQNQGTGQVADIRHQLEQSKAHAEQLDAQLARANQAVQALQTENTRLGTLLAAAQSKKGPTAPPAQQPSQPDMGMLIWNGKIKGKEPVEIAGKVASIGTVVRGALPSAPFIIYQGDPDRVDIRQTPTAQNGYRLIFSRKNGGNATSVFFWVLAK
jgi:hypothetical protein